MRTHLYTVATVVLLVLAARGARGQCCGDCNNDGSVAINELVTAVTNALGECETRGCGLPATGQETPYGSGSDGDVEAGVPLSATDNGDGTITDNTTGLMWEKKDDAGGIHDQDNRYTWGTVGDLRHAMNGTMVTQFLAALNTTPCFAGHCDWRIPNVRELQSLVDYDMTEPAVRAEFNRNCEPGCTVNGIGRRGCSCTLSSSYWSSTTYDIARDSAWTVFFLDGGGSGIGKSSDANVRAVRGGL